VAVEEIRIQGRADMDEINQALAITGQSFRQFNKQLNKNFMVVTKNRQVVDQFSGKLQDVGQASKKAAIMGRRFKMEWLGIMFAGMALDRAFGGLVRTQLKLFGVTDMMSSAWTIVMLPVMEKILPLIYNLIEVFMNLPEKVKLVIGTFILFGAVFGKILLVVGQVMLAVTSLMVVGPIFLIAVAAISLFIPLMAILIGYFTNLEKNTKGARDQLVKFGVDGEIIDKIIQVAKKGFFWLMDFFPKLKDKIFEWFDSLWQGFKAKLPAMLDGMVNLLQRVWDWLVENIPRFIKMGGDLLISLVNGILKNIDKITSAITFLIDKIVQWVSKNITKVINAGMRILMAIVKGITDNIDKIVDALVEGIIALEHWIATHQREIWDIGLKLAGGIIKGLAKGMGNLVIGGIKATGISIKSITGYQTGGLVTQTGPAFLHAGERVIPKNKVKQGYGNGVTINATYNVNVSDKAEMERLLRDNNIRLVEEVKRQIAI